MAVGLGVGDSVGDGDGVSVGVGVGVSSASCAKSWTAATGGHHGRRRTMISGALATSKHSRTGDTLRPACARLTADARSTATRRPLSWSPRIQPEIFSPSSVACSSTARTAPTATTTASAPARCFPLLPR